MFGMVWLVSCVFLWRYKNRDHGATMSILDIGMLTGFEADTKDLDQVGA